MFFGSGDSRPTPRIVGMELRNAEEKDHDEDRDVNGEENKYNKRQSQKLSTWYSLVVLAMCLGILGLILLLDQRLPQPLTLQDAAELPHRFIEERARAVLQKLTSVGPRPAGSYENEVLAVDYIRRQLSYIQQKAKPLHKISIDLQKPRGSFNLEFVDGLTHHYRNIQNIIAKLESGHGGKHALLINCHFDSVPQSPGASDDAVSCSIMLELLEVLTQMDQPFKHNLIFLFNGAEENMLPGSHGFITQHIWAEDVRAFINLEACGSGGRELVFQTGPGHPWLVEAYAKVAPHPFASIIGQEIFQSGIIPGDTDFRIFRDFAHIPGIDIAYIKNGYVYHTKYDTEDRIPAGSIQRAGDNVLAVVLHLAQSDELAHTEHNSQGSVVFFDLFGLFLIHYPGWLGVLINVAVMVASVLTTTTKVGRCYEYGVTRKVYLQQLGYALAAQAAGCVASLVSVSMVAIILDLLGKTMSWYSKPYLILFLYVAPTIMSVVAVFHFALPRHKKFFRFVDGIWVVESLYFEISKLVWTLYTLVMTLFGLKSSFFCMIWVLFPMTGRCLLDRIYDRTATQRKTKDWKWFLLHLASVAVPLMLNMYLIWMTFTIFVPIMGRSGSAFNSDLVIGYKAAFMTLASISFLAPLVMVVQKPGHITSCLYMTTAITMILVATTRLGFPYSDSPSNLAPHRALVVHTSRQFFHKDGSLQKSDAGYFMVNMDRNSPRILLDWVPEIATAKEVDEEDCRQHLYCGVPVYYPCASMLRINHWIPSAAPKIYKEASIELVNVEETQSNVRRLLFQVTGPDHTGVLLCPVREASLVAWSFDERILTGPSWVDDRPTYYIFYSHGLNPTSWQFWIELKVPRRFVPGEDDLMDVAVVGHVLHGYDMKGAEFKKFLQQFPPWSFAVGWTASYKAYRF